MGLEDVTGDYYGIGTYCSVQYTQNSANKIVLRGIHRVDVKDIKAYNLLKEDSGEKSVEDVNKISDLLNLIDDYDDPTYAENDAEEQDEKEEEEQNFTSMESFLKSGMDSVRNAGKMRPDDNKLLICDIQKISNPKVNLSIEERVKMEHMLETARKIEISQQNPVLQGPPMNINDIDLFLDLYGGMVVGSKMFVFEDYINSYLEKDVIKRLDIMHDLIVKLYMLITNMNEIGKIATRNIMMKQSKEYYNELFEVVKNIADENKGQNKFINKLSEAMSRKKPPKHVMEIFNENAKRIMSLSNENSEKENLKTYLEWVSSIPYGVKSEDVFDLEHTQKALDKEHYGLQDVKDRILEFIAVGKIKKTLKGKILLLVGPPGTGKTSLAFSIAEALGRKCVRIALGGESDTATLKGHRRTYTGSYPGKIVQA